MLYFLGHNQFTSFPNHLRNLYEPVQSIKTTIGSTEPELEHKLCMYLSPKTAMMHSQQAKLEPRLNKQRLKQNEPYKL